MPATRQKTISPAVASGPSAGVVVPTGGAGILTQKARHHRTQGALYPSSRIKTRGTQSDVYPSSRIKRTRRTQAAVKRLLAATQAILSEQDGPISIRHLFYLLAAAGAIRKTEQDYQAVVSFLDRWRRAGVVPWSAFADSLRVRLGKDHAWSLEDALQDFKTEYALNPWLGHNVYVETWVEKDAMAGTLRPICDDLGIKLFVMRGFASLTSLWNTSEHFKRYTQAGYRVVVFYCGDHDPSGITIEESAVRTLRETFNATFDFQRLAVLPDQITRYQLPTRPTKNSSHSKSFSGDSVELDAMPVAVLREILVTAVSAFVDPEAVAHTRKQEQDDLRCLGELIERFTNRMEFAT